MAAEHPSFVDLLSLEHIDENIFRGSCHAGAPLRIFGGQVAAQALVAAGRTVDAERRVHSLHSYFLRPGRPTSPIVYLVDRVRDGSSFTTRRVQAVQNGEAIFVLSASFQREEQASEHQRPMPDVATPDQLPDPFQKWRDEDPDAYEASTTRLVMDLRFVESAMQLTPAPTQSVWMKAAVQLPDDPVLHVCALAYLSDLTLASTADLTHKDEPGELQMASLDHAMWFHRPFRADEWLLFVQESPSLSGSRGLARGEFYSQDGRLVASAMQEALIRRRVKPA